MEGFAWHGRDKMKMPVWFLGKNAQFACVYDAFGAEIGSIIGALNRCRRLDVVE